ncbi:hypothetical protein IEO21_08950 [Rhodonia placenta]|uniref:Carbohydrate-binding module family 19 domain-containing protein n=1 Tax=Rhodonia placenta TaxID=104341 RepID=A0A8H7NVP4_9APHY|nr:hypothetical protein IEO21_08950 [Postia placenta]
MSRLVALLLSLWTAMLIQAAPMNSLDAATFYQNGLDAQMLNGEFASLNATSACNTTTSACIAGSLAQCERGSWKIEACPATEQCFALPALRGNGTVLSCTTEDIALALINVTGVEGGLASAPNVTSSTNATAGASSSASATATESLAASGSFVVVTHTLTVTSTVQPSASSSFATTATPASTFAETTLLNPSQASSLLSSLSANGAFSIVTTLFGQPTPTVVANASDSVFPTTALADTFLNAMSSGTLTSIAPTATTRC